MMGRFKDNFLYLYDWISGFTLTDSCMMSDSSNSTNDHWRELETWRKQIDSIDRQLSDLLCQRLHCALNIIEVKSRIGENVLQPEREKEVLSNVLSQVGSPMIAHAIERIYRCIIEESRLFQHEWKSEQQSPASR